MNFLSLLVLAATVAASRVAPGLRTETQASLMPAIRKLGWLAFDAAGLAVFAMVIVGCFWLAFSGALATP
jgi:hypothetical protein